MFNRLAGCWFRFIGGRPCLQIYGRGRREKNWRIINVFATHRRNNDSRWPAPFWRGTLITWSASVISLGWDCAEALLREQIDEPASRAHPVEVPGGRLNPVLRPREAPATFASVSEIIAHECGHTWQAGRLGIFYIPIGSFFTLWREGVGFMHRFENQASEQGLFGGIVDGSVCPELMNRVGLTSS